MTKKEARKKEAEKNVAEFLKCKNSFSYFCRNHIYIEVPGDDVLLQPYKPQEDLIRLINTHRYVLVLKSRQIGISTIIQAYAAWLCIFHKNVVVGVISKDAKEATDFARAIRGMVEKIPDWMKPPKGTVGRGFAKRSEQSFILTNGSKVYASPVNPNRPENTLRGKAITFMIIDEAAFVNKLDEAWTGMVPALSTNQKAARKANVPYGTVVLSTPNKTVGIGKWFFERYSNAISGGDIFFPFVIHWRDVAELADDPEWYDTQCKLFDNNPKKIQQELELKFLPAGGSFFDENIIQVIQENKMEPIEKMKLFNGEVWQFSKPVPGRYYIIGVDTAPEHGEDKSAISVWDYESLEQVWEYQGKCQVFDFVKVIKYACAQYPGSLVVESNSYGNQVLEEMGMSEFNAMVYQEKRGVKTVLPGIATTAKTRPLMIDALYSYVCEFPEIIKSERLALELTGLVSKTNGRVEADTGCHDDIAFSAAVAFYVRKYDPPVLIDTTKFSESAFGAIMNMNDGMNQLPEMSNAAILKKISDNIEEHGGAVNIFDLFK